MLGLCDQASHTGFMDACTNFPKNDQYAQSIVTRKISITEKDRLILSQAYQDGYARGLIKKARIDNERLK